MHEDLDSLDHDTKLAQALGNMLVAWARAETVLVHAYAVATGLHLNICAAAYYKIPTFDSRTKALLAIIDERPDPFPERAALKSPVSSLVTLSKTRNQWVHAVWVSKTGSKLTQIFNMGKDGPSRVATQITANAVRQHVTAVQAQSRKIERLSPIMIKRRTKT